MTSLKPGIVTFLFAASAALPAWAQHGAWIELGGSATAGGISATPAWSGMPSMAVDKHDRPVVAWLDQSSGADCIYVRRWSGAAWEELGGSGSGGGISGAGSHSNSPTLALDRDGNPMVAWSESIFGNGEIYFRAWNGTAWAERAGSASGGGVSQTTEGWSQSPSLAADRWGMPVIAWQENADIHLRRWDGVAWVAVGNSASGGGISNTPLDSMMPSLVAGEGALFVAWQEGNYFWPYDLNIHLRMWNGTSWVELEGSATGGGISNTGHSQMPSIALVENRWPVVAWQEYVPFVGSEVYLKMWRGQWTGLGGSAAGGGISNSPGESSFASLACGPHGAHPVVAWAENDGDGTERICLRRWSGAAWKELGASATGNGIHGPLSFWPDVALDRAGNPVVAWQQALPDWNNEIYLNRWTTRGGFIAGGEVSEGADADEEGTRCGLLGLEAALVVLLIGGLRSSR